MAAGTLDAFEGADQFSQSLLFENTTLSHKVVVKTPRALERSVWAHFWDLWLERSVVTWRRSNSPLEHAQMALKVAAQAHF